MHRENSPESHVIGEAGRLRGVVERAQVFKVNTLGSCSVIGLVNRASISLSVKWAQYDHRRLAVKI